MRCLLLLAASIPVVSGCVRYHAISGTVLDRNGEPVERAVVGLEPGNVELVTDQRGQFTIDYLRERDGQRIDLGKRTDYRVEVFKAGFHESDMSFFYKKGEMTLEPLTLVEDTIRVDWGTDNLDPSLYPDRSQNNGAAYEGE